LESASAGSRMFVKPLTPHHDRAAFSCGVPELDDYLKSRASQHVARHVANVFVLVSTRGDREIIGYYTLSSYALVLGALAANLGKRLPSGIPLGATLLGRLAVDERHKGHGYGKFLLLYALREALRATRTASSLGVVVDAMTDDLVVFYKKYAFVELTDKPRHLIAPMNRIAELFPEETPSIPDLEQVRRQLAIIAEKLEDAQVTLTSANKDDKVVALAEDLRRRLAALTKQQG
jgi:GNAT superfamily N-acetyltransferase